MYLPATGRQRHQQRELLASTRRILGQCTLFKEILAFQKYEINSRSKDNVSLLQNFLTVGDWCARIWSEDIKESAIMWTRCLD